MLLGVKQKYFRSKILQILRAIRSISGLVTAVDRVIEVIKDFGVLYYGCCKYLQCTKILFVYAQCAGSVKHICFFFQ